MVSLFFHYLYYILDNQENGKVNLEGPLMVFNLSSVFTQRVQSVSLMGCERCLYEREDSCSARG